MELVWTQDERTGVNTIHRAGCRHTRMSDNVIPLAQDSLEAAMSHIVDDNIGGLSEGESLSDWVHVSPCAK
jgi:hypothetical protein